MGNRFELCIYIADFITKDKVYRERIVNDLYDNYSIDRLINAACEYTDLCLQDIEFNYIIK